MKELTAILLILIAVIGIISIIIVKLYYRDKEKDEDKKKLEEFIESTQSDYNDKKYRQTRRAAKNRTNYSEAQRYTNTIDSISKDEVKRGRRVRRAVTSDDFIENENVGGTTALLRQRAQAMENAPKKQVRRVRKAQGEPIPRKQVAAKKVARTPERVKTQMEKEEEVKSFQEPIKPVHTATINSAKQKVEQPKARQVPMTEKQKEFIAKDVNKLVVDDTDSAVKVVKSVKPAETIEELKDTAKIEEKTTAPEDKVVKEAEKDTAELIKKIEEAKEGVEEILAEVKEETPVETEETELKAEEKLAEIEEETPVEAKEELVETPIDAKEEIPAKDTELKAEEATITPEVEETSKVEEAKTTIVEGASKVSDKISEVAEKVYNDDLHLILNKGHKEEVVDETPENDFVTINSDTEESFSTSNELINNAIKSIRNFRKPNVPEKPVVENIKDDVIPEDYAQDLGDGIEYIGDTITITPIHEEEIDLANNQPNEDVDKIYKEINNEPYNKTDDEELSKSFEDVTDETSQKDANVYTVEDYKKIEAKEKEKVQRAENTKKILGSKGISEEELHNRTAAKAKSKRTRKAAVAEKPVDERQKRLMVHKVRDDVEEVYINGTLFELKVGQFVMYDIKGETYSSQILKLKPGYIGVRYRSKKIWVKSNSVKKILK